MFRGRTRFVIVVVVVGGALLPLGGCLDVVPAKTSFETDAERIAALQDAGAGSDTSSADIATPDTATPDTGANGDAVDDAKSGDPKDAATHKDGSETGDTSSPDGQTADTAEGDAANPDAANPDATSPDVTSPDAGPVNPCAGKADKTPCEDGDKCTTSFCKAGKCVTDANICVCKVTADCAKKEDGDACNGTLYCDTTTPKNACRVNPSTVVTCDVSSDGKCKTTTCDKKTGKCVVKIPPAGKIVLCDADGDGNTCSKTDRCEDGKCTLGTNICTCKEDKDCAAKEDGDLCNGTLYCDITLTVPACAVNPATVVGCKKSQPSLCGTHGCDPKTGKCTFKAKGDNNACDDDNPCTVGDVCKAGSCKPGTDLCACSKAADCAKFDDGNPCNGTFFCNAATGKCLLNPTTVVACKDNDACTTTACDPKTNKCVTKPVAAGALCDADSNPCTAFDSCDGKGTCEKGTPICVCQKDADCSSNEDGDLCNGTLYCDKSTSPASCKVNPKTVKTCKTAGDTACEKTVCVKKTGTCKKQPEPEFTACEDGNKCTAGDRCESGKCIGGIDLCACKSDSDCVDDGNPCNGVPYCDKTSQPFACKTLAKSAISCTGGIGCAPKACDPTTGKCSPLADAAKCDDNNPCSMDTCDISGQCSHIPLVDATSCGADKACVKAVCKSVPAGMVSIPSATFFMGCNSAVDPDCAADEKSQHEVSLKPFAIDRYEVTAAAYAECVAKGNCNKVTSTDPACNHADPKRKNHPANCLTFSQAKQVCQQLGKRLPTEAEWEAAARGSCKLWGVNCAKKMPRYPWAGPAASCNIAVMLGTTKSGCDLETTRAVGSFNKDKSPFGAVDMGGNVSEWTEDWYSAGPWSAGKAVDPPGPVTGTMRVVRGGNLTSDSKGVRAGRRSATKPDAVSASIGVRCAADVK